MKLSPVLQRALTALGVVSLADGPDVELTLPMRAKNEGNAHQHWRARHQRAKAARQGLGAVVRVALFRHAKLPELKALRAGAPGRIVVVLERVAPRAYDLGDNLSSSLKAARDGVSDALGIDDSPKTSIDWLYSQRRGEPRQHGVSVQLFIRLGAE
ncbi:MAG: hypothetical protein QM817_10245 [Archangium sp.]